jgi:hypothetical protein
MTGAVRRRPAPGCARPACPAVRRAGSARRSPPCSATTGADASTRTARSGARLRLADRGRAAQPARRRATGLRLPATLVFDYPTPRALAGTCATSCSARAAGDAAPRAAPRADDRRADRDRRHGLPLPRRRRARRRTCGGWSPRGATRSPVPADRGWDLDALYDPTPTARQDLHPRRRLPARRRRVRRRSSSASRPREALAMDPQQRLLLETSWEALERPASTPPRCAAADRRVRRRHVPRLRPRLHGAVPATSRATCGTGTAAASSPAGVLHLGLEGPAVTVDTACSSSLVALHLAAQALRAASATLALAGGVTVMSTPARSSSSPGSAAWPPTAAARRSPTPPTAPAGPRASACSCWSGCPTPGATATRCSPSCAAPRSTRTARPTASPPRTARRSSG